MGTVGIVVPLLVALSTPAEVIPWEPKAEEVAKKLAFPVFIPKPLKQISLEQALTILADQCMVVFDIDEIAFRKQGIKNILDCKVTLIAQNQTPLGDVLAQLLKQVAGGFRVRPGMIEIVPNPKL